MMGFHDSCAVKLARMEGLDAEPASWPGRMPRTRDMHVAMWREATSSRRLPQRGAFHGSNVLTVFIPTRAPWAFSGAPTKNIAYQGIAWYGMA